jgi:hypothetical protein
MDDIFYERLMYCPEFDSGSEQWEQMMMMISAALKLLQKRGNTFVYWTACSS